MNEILQPSIALALSATRSAQLRRDAADYRLAASARRGRAGQRGRWWDRLRGRGGFPGAPAGTPRPALS
jgi:hypothetical protein